jgi:hypothetical protein
MKMVVQELELVLERPNAFVHVWAQGAPILAGDMIPWRRGGLVFQLKSHTAVGHCFKRRTAQKQPFHDFPIDDERRRKRQLDGVLPGKRCPTNRAAKTLLRK